MLENMVLALRRDHPHYGPQSDSKVLMFIGKV